MTDPLLSDLEAERELPEGQRPTAALTAALDLAIAAVGEGSVPKRRADELRRAVVDGWSYTAPLSERLLAWLDANER